MGLISQCKNCSSFLTSSEYTSLEKHYNICKQIPKQCESILDPVEERQNKSFHWRSTILQVSFPEVRINLPKILESNTDKLLIKLKTRCDIPPTQDEDVAHTSRARTKSLKVSKTSESNSKKKVSKLKANVAKKKKTSNQIDDPLIRQFRFSCSKCPAKFTENFDYQRHMNVHNGSRKLISCVVCTRIFNRRDSLNAHLTAHEVAEEKEKKYNLLKSCPPKLMNNDPKRSVYSRSRLYCKYCLMFHTNHESLLAHHQSEHGQSSKFPCRYDCDQVFTSIKDLLCHAKSAHTKQFHGKLTYFRMTKGIFTGKNSRKDSTAMDSTDYRKNSNSKVRKSSKKTNRISKKPKKVKNREFTDSEDSDDLNEMHSFRTGTLSRPKTNSSNSNFEQTSFSSGNITERNIEIERVSIIHHVIGDVNNLQVEVEPQNENCGQTVQDIVVKVEPTDIYSESEPILLNIKTECI